MLLKIYNAMFYKALYALKRLRYFAKAICREIKMIKKNVN